jgi:hypothetical protein
MYRGLYTAGEAVARNPFTCRECLHPILQPFIDSRLIQIVTIGMAATAQYYNQYLFLLMVPAMVALERLDYFCGIFCGLGDYLCLRRPVGSVDENTMTEIRVEPNTLNNRV